MLVRSTALEKWQDMHVEPFLLKLHFEKDGKLDDFDEEVLLST
jgi:hypothetical protein